MVSDHGTVHKKVFMVSPWYVGRRWVRSRIVVAPAPIAPVAAADTGPGLPPLAQLFHIHPASRDTVEDNDNEDGKDRSDFSHIDLF